MPERLRVFAGDCVIETEGTRTRTQRGFVVVVVKPDNTTLVHDADGYQPVAWLTRPESVTIEGDGEGRSSPDDQSQPDAGGFTITARDGEQQLRVVSRDPVGHRIFPITEAGVPAGDCPDCAGPLVRSGGDVVCLGCEARYGLPTGATVTDGICDDCGLPQLRVERAGVFHVCLDPRCEALADRVRERFDETWDCPDCDGALGVQEAEGRVFLGCTTYPDCETTFSIPSGTVVEECDCGLPVFETASGRRCLDGTCARRLAESGDETRGDGGRTLESFASEATTAAEEYVDGDCPRE